MDIHKERCKKLKEIRKKVANKIGVDLHQTECTYDGKCSGTCPKCQQEEQRLNQALLAKTALATGVVAMSIGLTGCNFGQTAGEEQALEGETEPISSTCSASEDDLEGDTTVEDTEDDEKSTEIEEIVELEGDVVYIPEEEDTKSPEK